MKNHNKQEGETREKTKMKCGTISSNFVDWGKNE
jgi:hypothetical protein